MNEIGRIVTLKIDHLDNRGAWLQCGKQQILLPRREVPAGSGPGADIRVFILPGSSGQVVATSRLPTVQLDQFALLRVREVTRHGAFLDWGLEKDLLVPYGEQPEKMRAGRRYLVKVCLDSSGRLVGTGRIERCLETERIELVEGQAVDLLVWQFTDLGAKVIVDDLYGGLLFQDEIRGGLRRGDRLRGFVKQIREDRKIDVALRRVGAEGIEEAKSIILDALRKNPFLALHDRSSPEAIQQTLGLSKKMFKKALGGLYKEGVVELRDEGVRLKDS